MSVGLQLGGLRWHAGLGEASPLPIVLDNPKKLLDSAANLLLSVIATTVLYYGNCLEK